MPRAGYKTSQQVETALACVRELLCYPPGVEPGQTL